jgi:PAS domain S-box-containing protein
MNAYEYIVNTSKDFITLINRDYVYELVNDSYCQEMGKTRDQILSRSVADIWGKDTFEKN